MTSVLRLAYRVLTREPSRDLTRPVAAAVSVPRVTSDPAAKPLCAVCSTPMGHYADGRVLEKYDVAYLRCPSCRMISLPDPHWLDEAYERAIYTGDTGLLRRCRILTTVTSAVIRAEGIGKGTFLDWAGGYGTLTRMMRDRGFEFLHTDAYCDNIFAQGFEGDPADGRYDLVTAYEVMEHLADPYAELEKLARTTDRILFTTELQPDDAPQLGDWWYFLPESGQHITFHTERSLGILAERLGYQLLSNGDQYHLFHRGPVRPGTRVVLSKAIARGKRRGVAAARAAVSRAR